MPHLGIAATKTLPDSVVFHETTIQETPYMTREFEVDGPGILKVFTLAGDVEVEETPNTHKVRIELYVDRGYAFWSNTKNLDNYRITMLKRGNEIVASVEQKSKETGFFSDQMKFSFKVFVPQAMSTQLKSSGGDIHINGLRGDQLAKTSGGNIEVRNAVGKIAAYTSGGNIGIRTSEGTIYGQTEGGNINIAESGGEIRLRSNGGNVRAEQISGSMLARVEGGNIKASFIEVSQGISLETTAGDIFLDIPRDGGYDIAVRASKINFPALPGFTGTQRSNMVEGTSNNGGSTINLVTEYGTVTLETGIY
ncbi:Putative adhesin [Gracilimonas mengyeensis]|uniref:Adhesin n=2 Tax=Gracilimonas mengyeensis TaxID=1302730 RepID=A0A521EA64_9BACT|nr:Putative adhesin [Gracilimonas mengyeensis]